MNEVSENARDLVLKYVKALDSKNYELAASYIADDVRIFGPVGESFGKPRDFTNMLKRYQGDYNILKTFVDGSDVSLLYEFLFEGRPVYMSSWYRTEGGKIVFIRTVFDPSAFTSESQR